MGKLQVNKNILNFIRKNSNENNGDWVNQFVKKVSKNYKDQEMIYDAFETIAGVSLYSAAREFSREKEFLQRKSDENNSDEIIKMREALNKVADEILTKTAVDYLSSKDDGHFSESLLALYVVQNESACAEFMHSKHRVSNYVFKIQEMLFHDNDLSKHIFDVFLFLLNGARGIDDYAHSRCIRAVNFNDDMIQDLLVQKENEICDLASWFFQNGQYISLSNLMRLFENSTRLYNTFKCDVYKYARTTKEDFLEKAFADGSAKALELYFKVKFHENFPSLEEVKPILALNTSASIYCIVLECLRKINMDNYVEDSVIEIMIHIKESMRIKELDFDFTDEFEDRGIENGLLNVYMWQNFHSLCVNEQDVQEYLSLFSFFNIFGNEDLRLNYNLSKFPKSVELFAEWQNDYAYIYDRYEHDAIALCYIIANSYLRFYIDFVELFDKFGYYLKKYWFPGYITNDGKIHVYQVNNNPEFKEKGYRIYRKYDEIGAHDAKRTPEETQMVRFKLNKVEDYNHITSYERSTNTRQYNYTKSVNICKVETIPSQFKRVIYRVIYAALLNRNCNKAYYYLKSLEKTNLNLYNHDKFSSLITQDLEKEELKQIGDYVLEQEKDNKGYLRYIYLNSPLKTYFPFDKAVRLFLAEGYLLGSLYYIDNRDFRTSDRYYLQPNYYNPAGVKLYIAKAKLSNEFRAFIDGQLKIYERRAERDSKFIKTDLSDFDNQRQGNVRVSFYLSAETINQITELADKEQNLNSSLDAQEENGFVNTEFEVNNIYLHCCDHEIKDLSVALVTYYLRVFKMSRDGIGFNILRKFMSEYELSTMLDSNLENGAKAELIRFYCSYLKLVYYEIIAINERIAINESLPVEERRNIRYKWFDRYTKTGLACLQEEIFHGDIPVNEKLKKMLLEDDYFKGILDALKGNENLRKVIYDVTVIGKLYDSFEDFDFAVDNTIIDRGLIATLKKK